jgi:hypothetical protein
MNQVRGTFEIHTELKFWTLFAVILFVKNLACGVFRVGDGKSMSQLKVSLIQLPILSNPHGLRISDLPCRSRARHTQLFEIQTLSFRLHSAAAAELTTERLATRLHLPILSDS